MSRHAGKSIIFFDQGMLKDRHSKPVHGVELFRMMLIRDLLERGLRVTVAADRSWKRIFHDHSPDPAPRPELLCPPAPVFNTLGNSIVAAAMASRRREPFDACVFGDPRRGLRPAMRIATALRIARRYLAFSHRHPTPQTAASIRRLGIPVLAVSDDVAQGFREAGIPNIAVSYGLPNAQAFHPPTTVRGPGDEAHPDGSHKKTRIILLGRMPNHFKGHDIAIESFRAMDPALRERAELHLVSYIEPVQLDHPGVTAHMWTRPTEIPDLLRSMDIMIAPSRNETFSQAVVQGMLTELPVIASPLPVFTEKLDTGAGIICRTPGEYTAALEALIRDPARRRAMGALGRKLALDRFVWNTDRFLDEHLFPEG
ncbi:MAG: glycosyltransferase family 4 protein [Phycisphaerales bacterium]